MKTPYAGFDRRRVARTESLVGVFLTRLWSLIAYSDTTPTRFLLAVAATGWAVLLVTQGDSFSRAAYVYMAQIGSEEAWSLFWAIHAAGMYWRIFSSRPRKYWALAIHSLGIVLFAGSSIAMFWALTVPLPTAIVTQVILTLAAFWVLIRTHINSEPGWRND